MRKHTRAEVYSMAIFVKDAMVQLLGTMGVEFNKAHILATKIIQESIEGLNEILDMPHGGSLAPEEIAEMLLSQYVYEQQGETNEEAAAIALVN